MIYNSMTILKNQIFDKSKYINPGKVELLKQFILEFNSFALTQKLSKVNDKINRLKRR